MPAISLSDALSIVGLVISVLFGIWGIYLALRRAKYPASLTFVREQSIALLDDFATRIPNLAVLYKDRPINQSVVLISGYRVNDGSVDITPEMTEQPLACGLPESCSWLEFKVTKTAHSLNVDSTIINDRTVHVRLGLFRRDESFAFQALALLDVAHSKKKPTDFAEKLSWSHRIASLGSVKTTSMPEPETKPKRDRLFRKAILIVMALFYAAFGLSQATGLGPFGSIPSIAYEFESDGKRFHLRLSPNRDGTTTVTNVETKEERKVDLAEFSKTGRFIVVRTERREPEKMLILSGVMTTLMSGFVLFMAFSKDYRRYRMRKLVAASAKEA